jgi:hypothetical protein
MIEQQWEKIVQTQINQTKHLGFWLWKISNIYRACTGRLFVRRDWSFFDTVRCLLVYLRARRFPVLEYARTLPGVKWLEY